MGCEDGYLVGVVPLLQQVPAQLHQEHGLMFIHLGVSISDTNLHPLMVNEEHVRRYSSNQRIPHH